MTINLDLTNKLSSAIDYDNGGGLTTFIDIALRPNLVENFEFRLFNFILNLDSELITKIEAQNQNFRELTEEGFFLIKEATISIDDVKGCDAQLRFRSQNGEAFHFNKTWPYSLKKGDKVYDIGGHLTLFPQLILNLEIVSNGNIAIQIEKTQCQYIHTYKELLEISRELNHDNPTTGAEPGMLFDLDFRNDFLETDIDGGVIVKSTP